MTDVGGSSNVDWLVGADCIHCLGSDMPYVDRRRCERLVIKVFSCASKVRPVRSRPRFPGGGTKVND
jgi:hypothetical protein